MGVAVTNAVITCVNTNPKTFTSKSAGYNGIKIFSEDITNTIVFTGVESNNLLINY